MTRSRRTSLLVGIGVGLVASIVVALLISRQSSGDDVVKIDAPADVAGKRVPTSPFEAFDDSGAKQVTFDDYLGDTPLVVNFWASYCGPCLKEMPDLEQVAQATAGKVRFLGINYTDEAGPARELAKKTGVTYDLARDPRGDLLGPMGGAGLPTTVLVAPDGTMKSTHVGALTSDALLAMLRETFPDAGI